MLPFFQLATGLDSSSRIKRLQAVRSTIKAASFLSVLSATATARRKDSITPAGTCFILLDSLHY
ncbi:hypothetical protein, partial [Herbiconiux daphne]